MTSSRMIKSLALVAAIAVPACTPASEEVLAQDSSELGAVAQQASYETWMKIVGSLEYGEQSAKVDYFKHPRYRAFKFAGDAGDKIVVDVRSTNGGDAMAWVLDDNFEVVAANDDAPSGGRDSHIEVTLPEHPSRTHYILFREYSLKSRTFVVSLAGTRNFTSCNVDADCVKVPEGCCARTFTAVAGDKAEAYRASLGCEAVLCPAVMIEKTDDVAQCNNNTHQCELVDPLAIRCAGHTMNMHTCPDGYTCAGAQIAVDVPGSCRKPCGGIVARACDANFTCIDDPTDDCDPANGGRDCGGICEPKFCGGFGNLACPDELVCIDNTADDCDYATGGADCGGVCANY